MFFKSVLRTVMLWWSVPLKCIHTMDNRHVEIWSKLVHMRMMQNWNRRAAIVVNIGKMTSFEIQQLQIVLEEHLAHILVKTLVVVKIDLYQFPQGVRILGSLLRMKTTENFNYCLLLYIWNSHCWLCQGLNLYATPPYYETNHWSKFLFPHNKQEI